MPSLTSSQFDLRVLKLLVVRRQVISSVSGIARVVVAVLCGTDTVAKLPRLPHETRRLSHSHIDGVAVAWRRVDAIDAKLKFGKGRKSR